MKLRIAYIASQIPTLSETFVYNEILMLRERGHFVRALSTREPETEVAEVAAQFADTDYLYDQGMFEILREFILFTISSPTAVVRASRWLISDLVALRIFSRNGIALVFQFVIGALVARRIIQSEITHIHAHFAHVPTQIAMYAAAMAGIPYSFTAHANDLFERGSLIKQKAERAKKVISISNYNHRHLVDLGVKEGKIEIVRCGISPKFLRMFETKASRRHQTSFNIGSIGRLIEKKGMDTLIRAVAILKEKGHRDIEVTIYGDGPERKALEDLIEEQALTNEIKLPGSICHEDLPNWLRDLNLFVLACKRDANGDQDGIPVVLMEAMAAGVPVISSKISGIPELICNDHSGILTPPDNPEELAAAIKQMKDDGDFADRCATNARRVVEVEFSLMRNVEKLEKVFHSKDT